MFFIRIYTISIFFIYSIFFVSYFPEFIWFISVKSWHIFINILTLKIFYSVTESFLVLFIVYPLLSAISSIDIESVDSSPLKFFSNQSFPCPYPGSRRGHAVCLQINILHITKLLLASSNSLVLLSYFSSSLSYRLSVSFLSSFSSSISSLAVSTIVLSASAFAFLFSISGFLLAALGLMKKAAIPPVVRTLIIAVIIISQGIFIYLKVIN